MIDLNPLAKALPGFLVQSIARFAKKHPDAVVSCIALYVTSFNGGSAWVNFETLEHSDAWVAKHAKTKGHVREDDAGRFCPFPNDFAFAQADEFNFPDFPDLHKAFGDDEQVQFQDPAGNVHTVDSCDASIGGPLLEVLGNALQSFTEFGSLKRATVFRMGVCVHNTDCELFWVHHADAAMKKKLKKAKPREYFWVEGKRKSSKEYWIEGGSSV